MVSFKNPARVLMSLAMVCALSLASTARAAETGTVTGKVMDKDGKAVSGAKIRLVTPTNDKGRKAADAPAAAPDKAKGEKVAPVAEGSSGTDGAYTLKDVPAGEYVVRANLKGTGNAMSKVTVKAGETATADLTLKMRGGGKGKGKGKDKGEDKDKKPA